MLPLANEYGLASVEGGNENNVIARLELVFLLALQLPVGVIYQDQDSRPPVGQSARFVACCTGSIHIIL
jgi:hypothetical protein